MRKGDYRVICDRTGRKLWASQCKMEWDGLLVQKTRDIWDPKPEYLEVPNTQENLNVPNARPEGEQIFYTPNPNDIP